MIKVDEFKRYLAIDKTALDNEIVQQPSLFFAVSEAFAEAAAERDALKEALATVDAKLDTEVREDFEKTDTKIVEGAIKANVQSSKKHEQAFKLYMAAKVRADVLNNLKDAFQTRAYMLRDLCQLFVANYFESASVRDTGITDRAVYDKRRQSLANARDARHK